MDNKLSFNCSPRFKRILFWIFAFLSISIMVFIFCLSAENGEKSNTTSHGFTLTVVKIICPNFEGLSEAAKEETIAHFHSIFRVLGHYSSFAALGFFCLGTVINSSLKWGNCKKISAAGLFSLLYAISDEIHQYFVPDRAFQLYDISIDSLGIISGMLILTAFVLLYNIIRQKSKNK